MYKNNDFRRHQVYTYAQWPGGLYGSPSMAGTRPGELELKIRIFMSHAIIGYWALPIMCLNQVHVVQCSTRNSILFLVENDR